MVFGLLFMLLLGTANAWAAETSATLTATTAVDSATKVVTIQGAISSGTGQQITLVVTNPAGNPDYIDQTVSGENGSFVFRYLLDESDSGTYQVLLGGTNVLEKKQLSFTYKKPSGGNNGPAPGPGGQQGGSPSGDTRLIVGEDGLKGGQSGGNVAIDVPAGKTEVVLPLRAAELLNGHKLVIVMEGVSVAVDPQVLADLQALVGAGDAAGAHLAFRLAALPEKEASDTVRSGQKEGTVYKSAGVLYRFELALATAQGDKKLASFPKPVHVTFPYADQGVQEDWLGVYYWNEANGEWEYIGGRTDKEKNRIEVDLYHFSRYAVLELDKRYDDLPSGHWAYNAVKALSAKHIISGVSNTKFSPQAWTTRAEFASLLARALGLQAKGDSGFVDVKAEAWYADAVAAAYEAGIVKGVDEKHFAPNVRIRREEMAVMLVRAYEHAAQVRLASEGMPKFLDVDEISVWASDAIQAAVQKKLLSGGPGNRFMPRSFTNRAEAAQAIYNLVAKANK